MGNSFEEKTDQKLEPQNEGERILWEHIEEADQPIRVTLKRINRIGRATFPESEMQTSESCSGHTQPDGTLLPDSQPVVFFRVNNEMNREKIIPFFRDIFQQAIEEANEKIGKTVVIYGPANKGSRYTAEGEYLFDGDEITDSDVRTYPSFACEVTLAGAEHADNVLQAFWDAFDKTLLKFDHIQISQQKTKEMFHRIPTTTRP